MSQLAPGFTTCLLKITSYLQTCGFEKDFDDKCSLFYHGQALAARISKQINRVTKDLNKDVKAFNEEERSPHCNLQTTLTFDAVKDPDGEFWCGLQAAAAEVAETDECLVPFSVKRKAVDLCHLLDRSREEQNLLKAEMENTWSYYFDQHGVVTEFFMALANHEHVLDIERGEELFARRKLLDIESTLLGLEKQLSMYISIEEPRYYFLGNIGTEATVYDDAEANVDDEEEIAVYAQINYSENELSENEYDNADDDEFVDDI